MSVLIEFAMFPTDKGTSVSLYVSKVIEQIKNSGFDYQLTAMGTIIETNTLKEALEVIESSYVSLQPDCERVYSTVKLDIKKDGENRIKGKVESVVNKIGQVNT